MKTVFVSLVLGIVLSLAGCTPFGPGTVARDRFEYSNSIGDSWKRQTLLNIVKLRYLDPPIFVDVGQIVSGYTLERGVNVSGQLFQEGAGDTGVEFGGHGTYTDRPTITYTPLTGNKFIKSLMTPLLPESVFFMIQSGWPADGVLLATATSLNGLKNQVSSISGTTPPDPDFLRAVALLRKIQLSGGVAMRIKQDVQKQQATILTFRREDISQETINDSIELRRLLRLDPDATEFELVFGETSTNPREIAILTRSILQLMSTIAAQVEVPAQDLTENRVAPGWESLPGVDESERMIRINSSNSRPENAFVAVEYHGHWFWIDDRDLRSKRVFSFMMLLFTLADTGEKEPLPLITIPTQ